MGKIPIDAKDQQINQFLNTKPKHKYVRRYDVVDTLDAARLFDPKHHPYENKDRLYRRITDACKDKLDQVSNLMASLPANYRNEVVSTDASRTVRLMKLQSVREGVYKSKPYKADDFTYYTRLLEESTEGIRLMMPKQFDALLREQMRPFLTTLQSISELSKAYGLQKKIPQFRIPSSLKQSENPGYLM